MITIYGADPGGYKERVKVIIEVACPKEAKFIDEKLLDHLRSGKFDKQVNSLSCWWCSAPGLFKIVCSVFAQDII